MIQFVSREEWGGVQPATSTRLPTVQGVAFHWEGPKMGTPVADKCDDHIRGIQRFHMKSRAWSDIAYNFIVCPHGKVYVGRGWGIRSAANGTNYGNDSFHAVCYLGGVDDPFTDAAKEAFITVVLESRRRYPKGKDVRPHSYFKATACPGDVIRGWVRTNPFSSATPPPVPPAPPAPAPVPVPPPVKGQDMAYIVTHSDTKSYVTDLLTKRHIAGPSHFDELVRGGVQSIKLSDSHIDAIRNEGG